MENNYKFDAKNYIKNCKNLLFDIEGTITSIAFVKDYLFPYIKNNLEGFIKSSWEKEQFKIIINQLIDQVNQDKLDGFENVPEIIFNDDSNIENNINSILANVLWQMNIDRKTTSLKNLQALIMKDGFEKGKLKGEFYSDVINNFKKWKNEGKILYIYSSGSVEAQKLIFKYSTEGDLLHMINGHFDTNIGPKTKLESYKNILKNLKLNPDEIIFFTDVIKEAEAASEAGIKSILVIRDGNSPLSSEDIQRFITIHSFNEL